MTLASPGVAINAFGTTNSDLVLEDLDVSGPGRGVGIQIQGANHRLEDITADHRATAINPDTCTNLKLIDLRIDAATTYGLQLGSATLPLLLQNVRVTNSSVGVYINNINGLITASPRTTLVIDPTAFPALGGSDTSIHLHAVSNVTLQGLELPGYTYGLRAETGASSNLVVSDINASGPGAGTGIYLNGAGHSVFDVTIRHRTTGLYAASSTGLRVDNLVSDLHTGSAMVIEQLAGALPTLTNLRLTNSGAGLQVYGSAGVSLAPWTLDPTAIADIGGNTSAMTFTSNVKGVTVQDLTLDGTSYGLDARSTTNSNLTIDGVDASAASSGGTGISLGGADNLVTGVTVSRRVTGLELGNGTNLRVQDSTADRNTTGLVLTSITTAMTPPTLSNLTLTNNGTALTLTASSGPSPAAPWLIQGTAFSSLAGNDVGITTSGGVKNVTFKNLVVRTPSTAIVASGAQDSDLTFDNVDVSGMGPTNGATGYGLDVRGSKAKLIGITANLRQFGVLAGSANMTIDGITASNCTGAGVYFYNLTPTTVPASVAGLALTNSQAAVYLNTVEGITLNGAMFTDLSGNMSGIRLAGDVKNSTFEDLVLPGRAYGIDGNNVATNHGNTFRRIDATASVHGVGVGLYVQGNNNLLETITAHRRITGVISLGTNNTLRDVSIDAASGYGLYIGGGVPISLTNIAVTNSQRGVWVTGFSGALDLDASKLTNLAGNLPAIRVDSSPGVTVNPNLGLTGPVSSEWSIAIPAVPGVPGNPTCGQTLTASTTLVGDLDCRHIVSGAALILGTDGIVFDGAGFTLHVPNADYGINVDQRSDVVIEDLVIASGRAKSIGVRIVGGSGSQVRNVTTHRQSYGVYTSGVGGLVVTNLTARASTTAGLYLGAPTSLPTLTNLRLVDGAAGLQANGLTGPYLLDATALADVSGNANSLHFQGGNVTKVTVSGLRLDGYTNGVNANAATNAELVLRDLDVSGVGATTERGTGITLSGNDHLVEDVVATKRNIGIIGSAVTRLALHRIDTASCTDYGVYLLNAVAPLTLDDLSLVDGGTGLYLGGFDGAYVDGLGAPQTTTIDADALTDLSGQRQRHPARGQRAQPHRRGPHHRHPHERHRRELRGQQRPRLRGPGAVGTGPRQWAPAPRGTPPRRRRRHAPPRHRRRGHHVERAHAAPRHRRAQP